MSVEITREMADLFVVEISGVFTYENQKTIEQAGSMEIKSKPANKIKVLVLAEDFAGWGKEGDWGDLTFLYESDQYINRVALVTDVKWRDEMLMFFGEGRRQAEIKFFAKGHRDAARKWLLQQS